MFSKTVPLLLCAAFLGCGGVEPCYEVLTAPSSREPFECSEPFDTPVDPEAEITVEWRVVTVRYVVVTSCCYTELDVDIVEQADHELRLSVDEGGAVCGCVCPERIPVSFTVCRPGDYRLLLGTAEYPFTVE